MTRSRPALQRLFDSRAGDLAVSLFWTAVSLAWGYLAGVDTPAGWGLLVLAGIVLVGRRHYPTLVLAVTVLCAAGFFIALQLPGGPETLAPGVALYTAAALGRRAVAAGTAVGAFLAIGVARLPEDSSSLWGVGAWLLVLVVSGELTRNRRAYLQYVEQRVADAEHGREEEARRRVAEERLRIAREVHDVVAHHASLINVQAGAALLRADQRPELARSALVEIKKASKEILVELRATLGTLRRFDEALPTAPVPSLARLPDLVAGARSAGLRVVTKVDGDAATLPSAVDLAAYRVVQEALTNAARHAGPTSVLVHLAHRADELAVSVTDDGPAGEPAAAAVPGNGTGLRGMRERVESLGGRLTAGPLDRGFAVHARLPLAGHP